MSASMLIHEAEREGVKIALTPGGKIHLEGGLAQREKWAGLIKAHRDEVVEALKTATNDPAHDPEEDRREAFDERAGYPRDEAERLAERQVQGRGTEMSWRWRIEFPDHALTVSFSPPATREEVLGDYPTATAAEPVRPSPGRWSTATALTPEDEAAIRAWLSRIGERDQDTVAEVIKACQRDAGAREYFTRRAHQTGKQMSLT